ncbi:MAG: methyltransferase type 11 [Oscillospiraceae bacterium]|jgi:SAM-dependent methyltransferase|nr:methyltransferase type 11 [Oscillospiraceae bacterium]
MQNHLQKNADRFTGFAKNYNHARPQTPPYVIELAKKFLGKSPDTVVDLGCGTGLSTFAWSFAAEEVIGIEPSKDMRDISTSKAKDYPNVRIIEGFSDSVPLADNSVDVITCSQSFHWMNPDSTLTEANRLLKSGGLFITYDSDWPPVCDWKAEQAYQKLFDLIHDIEENHPTVSKTFSRFEKTNHLENIKISGHFTYVREVVFMNRERGSAERLIDLALSQGNVQTILKMEPDLIKNELTDFIDTVHSILGDKEADFDFCYRMRIGVKV